MQNALLTIVLVVTNYLSSGQSAYQGILINGYYGCTQLYDPINAPHAQGNLQLGLQTGIAAIGGAAVSASGQHAYFASGLHGECVTNVD
jgi:hypothetical protein